MQTQLTFSQEDFPASHTASQVNGKAKRTAAICGQKCLEQLEKFSRPTLWVRMFSASLIGMGDWYSTKCRLTWKLRGTKYSRLYFQLVPKTHPTEGIEFGLWPTPVTSDATTGAIIGKNDVFKETNGLPRKINQNGTDGSVWLGRLVQMLPTPNASDSHNANNKDNHDVKRGYLRGYASMGILPTPREAASRGNCSNDRNRGNLEDAIAKLIPTPASIDYKGARTTEALKEAGRTETNSLPDFFHQPGKTSQLNPQFVAEMMGFPTDWTVLPFQNGAMSQ